MCNICAHSAHSTAEKIEEDEATPFDDGVAEGMVPSTAGYGGMYTRLKGEEPEQVKSRFEEIMQKVAIVGGAAVVLLAAFFILFDTPLEQGAPVHTPEEARILVEEGAQVGWGVTILVWVIQFVAGIGGYGLALFLILRWTNKLPNDSLPTNIIAVGAVGILFSVIGFVPCFGILVILYLAYSLYRLEWHELAIFFVLCVLCNVLLVLLKNGLIGAIGLLVT
jgi:hypothetical protein